MDSVKFTRLYDRDITKSIRTLAEESSYFKSKIFKSLIVVQNLNPDVPREYKRFISDFIKIWEDYADDLASKIRSSKGTPGVHTVKYDYAKDYIYAKDDYASVLPFADGVIQGIKSEKFKEPEDIEEFFKFTVNKAFHDKGDSVAALLDSVLINGITVDMTANTSKADAKLYDSIKTYKMFNSTDPMQLKKSSIKVVDFLSDEMADIIRELKHRNTRMFVSMVTHIVEYISYSLAAYATRIYLISQYAYPFIDTQHSDLAIRPIDESAGDSTGELAPEAAEFDISVNIMHGANELMCRDYTQCKAYIETLGTFVKAVGADPLFGTKKPDSNFYMNKNLLTPDNAFISKLMGNALYEYLIMDDSWMIMDRGSNIYTEMNHVLKEYMYNNTQAYPGSYTPKQELLYIIRGAHYDDTLNGYRKLVKDMYLSAGVILSRLACAIIDIEHWLNRGVGGPELNTAIINDISENIKMLKDLYTEIAVAFMHKGRDIELHFNNLKNAEYSKVENDLSLKLPYQKMDLSTNINMMNSVPNTTRVPYDILDLYDLPTFESLEMYDDYLRSLPGMDNDLYLSEAVGVSSIINFITSRISSIWQRLINFYENGQFKKAKEWVVNNGSSVTSLDFTGKSMTILPYKKTISPPKGYDNCINKLGSSNFNEKILESEDSKKAFIESLYPDKVIYGWFTDKNNTKAGPEMYRNLLLFYDSPANTKAGTPQAIKVSDGDLQEYVANWVDTIKGADALLEQLKQQKNTLDQAIANLKRVVVSIQNKQNNQVNESVYIEDGTGTPPKQNQGNDSNGQSGDQGQSGNAGSGMPTPPPTNATSNNSGGNDNPTGPNAVFLTGIQNAILQMWGSLPQIFIHVFVTEYKYLKDAYALGHNTQNAQPKQ